MASIQTQATIDVRHRTKTNKTKKHKTENRLSTRTLPKIWVWIQVLAEGKQSLYFLFIKTRRVTHIDQSANEREINLATREKIGINLLHTHKEQINKKAHHWKCLRINFTVLCYKITRYAC